MRQDLALSLIRSTVLSKTWSMLIRFRDDPEKAGIWVVN